MRYAILPLFALLLAACDSGSGEPTPPESPVGVWTGTRSFTQDTTAGGTRYQASGTYTLRMEVRSPETSGSPVVLYTSTQSGAVIRTRPGEEPETFSLNRDADLDYEWTYTPPTLTTRNDGTFTGYINWTLSGNEALGTVPILSPTSGYGAVFGITLRRQ